MVVIKVLKNSVFCLQMVCGDDPTNSLYMGGWFPRHHKGMPGKEPLHDRHWSPRVADLGFGGIRLRLEPERDTGQRVAMLGIQFRRRK